MKTYILIFFILIASIIVTLKLITSTEPITTPEVSLDLKRYDTDEPTYKHNDVANYAKSTNSEVNNRELMAFARAFVDVQSYMHKAGNNAHYNTTSKIVQSHGLSVEDYTKIASQMNKNPDFKNRVQRMINDTN